MNTDIKEMKIIDKRTVIISKINNDHTAYVMNYGIDEALFRDLLDNGLELKDKESLSNGELLMLMRALCKDGFVETVISIENHYNRDQKQINIYKSNIEQKLKAKGCTIINHCDWKPSFEMDTPIINKRNYLTILSENINKKENELSKKATELDELCNEIEQYRNNLERELKEQEEENKEYLKNQKNKISLEIEQYRNNLERELKEQEEENKEYLKNQKNKISLEIKQYRNNLERELKEQEEEKQRNIEKINNQNWYIHETTPKYEKLKNDFNKLIERYKNGTKICETLFQEAKEKWPDDLKKLEENINNHKSELSLLDERYNEKLKVITKLNDEIKDKEREINEINKTIINLKENGYNIIEKIFNQRNIKKDLEEELTEKLKRTYKMYILNGRSIPDFEIEYFKNAGLSDEDIQEIENIFN